MKKINIILLISILITCTTFSTSQACTSFSFDHNGQLFFGKNYDWHLERGLIIVNKRNVSKPALKNLNADPGPFAQWTSKYGSITFNQYGRELPAGGMNEAGLVIEIMMLKATKYPGPDSRPSLGCSQWIQYQLDNFSTVKQVIGSDSHVRIYRDAGVHFLAMDKYGNCAVIEFLDGEMIFYTQDNLPIKALTNSTYVKSMDYLKWHKGFGGDRFVPYSSSSLDRFVRTADMLKRHDTVLHTDPVEYAFDTLANAANPTSSWGTKWSIVYDTQNYRIYFRTYSNKKIRYFDFHSFDFSCQTPVKILDMRLDASGDVTPLFQDYIQKMNIDLIRHTFKNTTFLMNTPDDFLEELSQHPHKFECVD